MNEVFIDMRKQNRWVQKYFKNKDLVSVEELISCIEDLDSEIDTLNEQLREATKTDEERYDEYLWEEADRYNDDKRMGLI